jgi:TPR repeat protein
LLLSSDIFNGYAASMHFDENNLKVAQKIYFTIAQCYESGIGFGKDTDRATQFYRYAASLGHVKSKNNLAVRLLNNNHAEDEALKLLKEAAREGDAIAYFNLGHHSLSGLRTDKSTAYDYFAESATRGFLPAYKYLGFILQHGIEVNINPEAAALCYKKAQSREKNNYFEKSYEGYELRENLLKSGYIFYDEDEALLRREYELLFPMPVPKPKPVTALIWEEESVPMKTKKQERFSADSAKSANTLSSQRRAKGDRYWGREEHARYLDGVKACHGNEFDEDIDDLIRRKKVVDCVTISIFVGTRTSEQVRTHHQKYRQKILKEYQVGVQNSQNYAYKPNNNVSAWIK